MYGIKPIALDITKDKSVVTCVEKIFKEAGRIMDLSFQVRRTK